MTMLKRREETRSGSVSLSGSTATFNGFQQNLPAGGNDGDECGPSVMTRPHHITRTRTLQSCFWTRLFQTVCVFTPEAEPSLHLFILHRQTVSCKSGGSNPVIQMQVKNKEQNQRHLPRREIKTKNRAEEEDVSLHCQTEMQHYTEPAWMWVICGAGPLLPPPELSLKNNTAVREWDVALTLSDKPFKGLSSFVGAACA